MKADSPDSLAPQHVNLDALLELTSVASGTLDGLRGKMLEPHMRKRAPSYTGAQLAQLCGIDAKQVGYLAKRGDLPAGSHAANGARRSFSLEESRKWIAELAKIPGRPEGKGAATIAVVNFKGGSTKTTTAFNLAQGLTLRGRRVLLVDLDPQGSATTLTGLLPAAEVTEEQTAGMLFLRPLENAAPDLRYAVQPTYWDGLDIVPASPTLFHAEVLLPLHSVDPDVEWWNLLHRALEPLRSEYDYIILDTAPALSYLAVNAVAAADGLLMPLPAENLDYSSSVAFWNLLTETLAGLKNSRGYDKSFAFVRVLLSKIDGSKISEATVRDWIIHTYGPYMLPVEIPKSPVASFGAVQFGTVYDMARYEGSAVTYRRIRDAYDKLVELIDQATLSTVWSAA